MDVGSSARAIACRTNWSVATVYVNHYKNVSVMSPAGGYKASGIGRENGSEMIKEYLQVKSVWINTA